jgi:ABC-type bacteriocin/lantibiotic exporter with double-glycine peptidase domain
MRVNSGHRRLLVSEVIQTSEMDCGPACLASLLRGFDIRASYERLREACHTSLDGTSIDTLEDVANQPGLEAEQVMLPVDHLLLAKTHTLPAIVVVRLGPQERTHFVVAWRKHGQLVQLMDPAAGRQWVSRQSFLNDVFVHRMQVPACDWRAWAASEEFIEALRLRIAALGAPKKRATALIETALSDPSWYSLAALDAAARMMTSLGQRSGLGQGQKTNQLLEAVFLLATESSSELSSIPTHYWSVRRDTQAPDDTLVMQGAVLVRARGLRTAAEVSTPVSFSPELEAVRQAAPIRPAVELFRMLKVDGQFTLAAITAGLGAAAACQVAKAVLLRGFFEVGRELALREQRIGAILAVCLFLGATVCIESSAYAGLLRLGRRLEFRLRALFLDKTRGLGDAFFRSRSSSDLAARSHNIHWIRHLPELSGRFIRTICELFFIVVGIAWLDPRSAPLALLAAGSSILLPLCFLPVLMERDLRVRTHAGGLCRFYLDALLGSLSIRVTGAERAMRREHDALVGHWASAALRLHASLNWVESLQTLIGFGFAIWLVFRTLAQPAEAGMVLLLIYWALSLPQLGYQLALQLRQAPHFRSLLLRLLEPLQASTLEEPSVMPAGAIRGEDELSVSASLPTGRKLSAETSPPEAAVTECGETRRRPPLEKRPGVSIEMRDVQLRIDGQTILEGLNLSIGAGDHVAIVGPSGVGKSSLLGLLLGFSSPSKGELLVDGHPLEQVQISVLRKHTVWIDPSVQLWNRSLLGNLSYAAGSSQDIPWEQVIPEAGLRTALERFPEGLQTRLGEGGGLVSGGEGQRVRIGRGLAGSAPRLVILDEPFRGLDREQRREMLTRLRERWRLATLLCVTHDLADTLDFDRVVVVSSGQVVEDGRPEELLEVKGSRYRLLLDQEENVCRQPGSSARWRRIWLEGGSLVEEPGDAPCAEPVAKRAGA